MGEAERRQRRTSSRLGHQPWDENFRRQALRATSPHHRSRGLPGSSRPWSDGLKLTLTGASQDLERPWFRAAEWYPAVAGSGDKQAKAKLCRLEIRPERRQHTQLATSRG